MTSRLGAVHMVTRSEFDTRGAADEKQHSVVFIADGRTVSWSSEED